jgi:hypothetical protein
MGVVYTFEFEMPDSAVKPVTVSCTAPFHAS